MSLATQVSALAQRVAAELKLRGMPPGGAPGQVLAKSTEADFDAKWASPTAGAPRTTTAIAGATGTGTVVLASSASLLHVSLSAAARFRLYRSAAQRAADASRAAGTDPVGDAVLLDVKLAAGGSLWLNPVAYVASDAVTYYWAVDGAADVTLTWEGPTS